MIKYTVKIDGMMCGMCEAHINDTIRKAFPEAKKVSSSRKNGEAVFLTEDEINEKQRVLYLFGICRKSYQKRS